MSSSNIAVRTEHTVTDLLSHPPRTGRTEKRVRPRISLTNRKSVKRDHGLRLFRIR